MDRPHCPSARPEWNGSFVFGISAGSVDEPRVVFLDAPLEVTDEIRQMTEGVALTEVFRFAAPCVNAACQQYAGGRCTLSRRTVELLPTVTTALPDCLIRPTCRWYAEEGEEACFRCPQVVTDRPSTDPVLVALTTPPAR